MEIYLSFHYTIFHYTGRQESTWNRETIGKPTTVQASFESYAKADGSHLQGQRRQRALRPHRRRPMHSRLQTRGKVIIFISTIVYSHT